MKVPRSNFLVGETIEQGWEGLRNMAWPERTPEQERQLRMAFHGGVFWLRVQLAVELREGRSLREVIDRLDREEGEYLASIVAPKTGGGE